MEIQETENFNRLTHMKKAKIKYLQIISTKGLVYKELSQTQERETTHLKISKSYEQTFLQRRHAIGKLPRCSTSLGTGKWLVMMMMMMMIILQKVTSVEEDVEKSEPSNTVGENVKWYSCFGK